MRPSPIGRSSGGGVIELMVEGVRAVGKETRIRAYIRDNDFIYITPGSSPLSG